MSRIQIRKVVLVGLLLGNTIISGGSKRLEDHTVFFLGPIVVKYIEAASMCHTAGNLMSNRCGASHIENTERKLIQSVKNRLTYHSAE